MLRHHHYLITLRLVTLATVRKVNKVHATLYFIIALLCLAFDGFEDLLIITGFSDWLIVCLIVDL